MPVENGKLYVGVEGTVEVECEECGGKGYHVLFMPYSGNEPQRTGCGGCHGTGRVTRRVSGLVECYASAEGDDSDDVFYSCKDYNRYANTPEELANTILADFRLYLSGVPIGRGLDEAALPDAVRAQLEVEDET